MYILECFHKILESIKLATGRQNWLFMSIYPFIDSWKSQHNIQFLVIFNNHVNICVKRPNDKACIHLLGVGVFLHMVKLGNQKEQPLYIKMLEH